MTALIIAFASLQAAWQGMRLFLRHPHEPEERKAEIRLRLGRWLSLIFEFLRAGDILLTAIAHQERDWQAGRHCTLRTLLNFFLELAIGNAETRGNNT